MIRLLQSKWAVIALGIVAYMMTTVLLWKTPHPPHRPRAQDTSRPGEDVFAVLKRDNPDIDQLVSELKLQKENLAKREEQLNELALRLQSERAEINSVTQNLFRLQTEFDKNVTRVREEEVANLKKLAKVYAAMAPEGAAMVIKELPDDQAVKVLLFMKDTESAQILESMAKTGEQDVRRVAQLSEKIRLSLPRPTNSKTQSQ